MARRSVKIAMVTAVAALAIGGGAAAAVPVWHDSTPPSAQDQADRKAEHVKRLTETLKPLVDDGTLTQAQADKVAQRLADQAPMGGPGRRGAMRGEMKAGLTAAAKTLAMSEDDVRSALAEGKTLAQLATEKKVDRQKLIDDIVAAVKAQLATDVKDGRLTQAQVDRMTADLPSRVAAQVDGQRGPGMGKGMRGGHHGFDGDTAPDRPAPSPTS